MFCEQHQDMGAISANSSFEIFGSSSTNPAGSLAKIFLPINGIDCFSRRTTLIHWGSFNKPHDNCYFILSLLDTSVSSSTAWGKAVNDIQSRWSDPTNRLWTEWEPLKLEDFILKIVHSKYSVRTALKDLAQAVSHTLSIMLCYRVSWAKHILKSWIFILHAWVSCAKPYIQFLFIDQK